MSSRFGWLVTLLWITVVVACAEGTPAEPAVQVLGQMPDAGSSCGDNIVDMAKGELCDCPETTTTMCTAPPEITCEKLGMGSGTVYCDPKLCTFITACSLGATVGGGSGAGG